MATVTANPLPDQAREESRIVLRNVSWGTYEALVKESGESHVRMTYDQGSLELMSPSIPHESYKKKFARLIETMAEELEIPIRCGGSATFRSRILAKGLEPDECYWVQNEPVVGIKPDLDLSVDPPPDLAVEIDITSSSLDREVIYAALGIPEVWRFDGEAVEILHRQSGGAYAACDQSLCFPFLPINVIAEFLQRFATENEWKVVRSFRVWVRDELGPTWRGRPDAVEGP